MEKYLNITKPRVVIENKFCHSLGISLYRGSTVTGFFPLHPNLPTYFPLICKVILFCLLIYIFLNQNRSLYNLKNAKIVWNERLQIILCGVLEGLEHRNAINTVTDPGEGAGGQPPPPPPLFLDQTETRRAEKFFLSPGTPPHLSQGLDDRPEVKFLWESIDWARNKWSLSALLGVRIERVELTENVRAFPRDKENCP